MRELIIMKKLLLTLLITSSVSAHQLVHQDGNDGKRVCSNAVGPVNLNEREILDWWDLYLGLNSDLVDASKLPELNPGDECSFYAETCGEVDHFMKAAQGAAQCCAENYGGVPFFTGPESFMKAKDEGTQGSHHDLYHTNDGISFMCLAECEQSEHIIR